MKDRRQYNLFHYRWIIPVIDVLYRHDGAKFVTLLHELKISRSVLRSTLLKMAAGGFAIRNPGYGHPMRPEYILTDEGLRLGPFCAEMMICINENYGFHLFRSKWALQIINQCSQGEMRFSELKSALKPITSRALSWELKTLEAIGYLERKIVAGYPPLATYSLAKKAFPFKKVIKRHEDVLILFL